MDRCRCGSYAVNDDPSGKLCDKCLRDDRIATLEAQLASKDKRIAELEKECATPILVNTARLAEQLADERAKVEKLRGFAERIEEWSRAYPVSVFPEPTPAQVDDVCKALGFRIDRISAMVLRACTKPFGDMAREILAATEPKE